VPAEASRAELKRIAYVTRLWQAFADGGVDELSPLVPSDVQWSPPGGPSALRGTEELRSFLDAHPDRDMPMPIAYEPHPEGVLVHAEHLDPQKGMRHLWLLYRFEGDRLVEALSFEDEAEARADRRRS
jgi:hypothetical protein